MELHQSFFFFLINWQTKKIASNHLFFYGGAG